MKHRDKRIFSKGQGLLEYALLITIVVLAIIFILSLFGVSVNELYQSILSALNLDGSPASESATCNTMYESDFDDNLDDWSLLSGGIWNGGEADTDDGQVVLDPLTGLILDGFTGSDYIINIGSPHLNNISNNWQGFGVSFRASQTKKGKLVGYMFEVEKKNKSDSGSMFFSKWVNGNQVKPPLALKDLDSNFNWEYPGNWKLVIAGDTFTAFINGVPVLSAQDSTFTEGSVGINSNSGTQLFLDDFSIESSGCAE